MSEARAAGWRERLALETLACLAEPSCAEDAIRKILELIHRATGLEQTGLRLLEHGDYPFYAYHGYTEEFLRHESSLAERGPDGMVCLDEKGVPELACLCGRVLRGETGAASRAPALSEDCFTSGGSFLTPSWSGLAPRAAQLGLTRGRCLAIGTETHALIPLRQQGSSRPIGLFHFADPRPGLLSLEEVTFFEGLGASIGVALTRRRDEELRRELEATYRGIFEKLGLGYALHEMIFDARGRPKDYRTLEINQAFERILHASREEVVGKLASSILPEPELERWLELFGASIQGGEQQVYQVHSPLNDKHFRGCAFAARPELFVGGRAPSAAHAYFAACFEDVSEATLAQAELARSRAELRRLALALQDGIEEERARIARELHDELSSGLVGMQLDARWLQDHLATDDDELRRCAHSLAESADALGAISRRITTDLRPPILDHMGLPAAIEWLARELERRTGVCCELELPKQLELDPVRSTALFRAVQEALTNVARHAGASRVAIRLAVEPGGSLRLEVRDDGRGLGPTRDGGLGLAGMRERIQHHGGTLTISTEDQGTRLTIELPLSR